MKLQINEYNTTTHHPLTPPPQTRKNNTTGTTWAEFYRRGGYVSLKIYPLPCYSALHRKAVALGLPALPYPGNSSRWQGVVLREIAAIVFPAFSGHCLPESEPSHHCDCRHPIAVYLNAPAAVYFSRVQGMSTFRFSDTSLPPHPPPPYETVSSMKQ